MTHKTYSRKEVLVVIVVAFFIGLFAGMGVFLVI